MTENVMTLTLGAAESMHLPSGMIVDIAKCSLRFERWCGKPVHDTYGGKPVIDMEGAPSFAELAILRLFEKDGWQGVWVDTYRRKFRTDLPEIKAPVSLPPLKQEIIDRIKKGVGGLKGCWDVFVWDKNDQIRFIESKHRGKDAIRNTQLKWLEVALELGFALDRFMVVEWDFVS